MGDGVVNVQVKVQSKRSYIGHHSLINKKVIRRAEKRLVSGGLVSPQAKKVAYQKSLGPIIIMKKIFFSALV